MNDKQNNERGGFLQLWLYRHPSGATLNPDQVSEHLKSAFPELEMLPGDQLATSVARIEKATAAERARDPASPLHRVLESERRKAQTFGPAYAFQSRGGPPPNLSARVRRYDITFLYDAPLEAALRQRVLAFLLSFGVGRIEESVPDARQTLTLYDLPGNEVSPPSPPTSSLDVPEQGTKST
jgi:hypothetical protein